MYLLYIWPGQTEALGLLLLCLTLARLYYFNVYKHFSLPFPQCLYPHLWNLCIYQVAWQRGIKVTDRNRVVHQLNLAQKVLRLARCAQCNYMVLKYGRRRWLGQHGAKREGLNWPLLALNEHEPRVTRVKWCIKKEKSPECSQSLRKNAGQQTP